MPVPFVAKFKINLVFFFFFFPEDHAALWNYLGNFFPLIFIEIAVYGDI